MPVAKTSAQISLGGGATMVQQPNIQQPNYSQGQPATAMEAPEQNHVRTNSYMDELQEQLSPKAKSSSRRTSQQVGEPPKFVKQLKSNFKVDEGNSVHLECRVLPFNDSSLTTEWYKDGRPLNAGSRFNTNFDRGYVSLDILYTYPEDSGEYSCVVKSNFGMDQTNPSTLLVLPEENVITDSQLPEDSMMQNIDALDDKLSQQMKRQDFDDKIPQAPPTFTKPLKNISLNENQLAHFETRATPGADPYMQVEWFKNGQSVTLGSRIRAVYERGYTALDILYAYPSDSGLYYAVATNKHGKAQSSQGELHCVGSDGVVTKSALPESSIQSLKKLEELGEEYNQILKEVLTEPPRFKSAVSPPKLEVKENTPATFEVQVYPGTGNRVEVFWFRDGKQIQTGSRINTTFEMNLAVLDIYYAYAEDTGSYCAMVLGDHGQDQSTTVQLVCHAEDGIVTASQLPGNAQQGMQSLMALEEQINQGQFSGVMEVAEVHQPPRISRQPNQPAQLMENDPLYMEAIVEPVRDGSMDVNWFKNGMAVTYGSRFRIQFESGRASLHILYTYPEDSGEYWVTAQNKQGTVESNHVQVMCVPGEHVVTACQLPGESQGYKKWEELEKEWREAPVTDEEYLFRHYEEPPSAPTFDIFPEPNTVCEGYTARFLVKVGGSPKPRIIWYINDKQMTNTPNMKIYQDGSINYLEILRCKDVGDSRLVVTAKNGHGEISSETVLNVIPVEDFRPDLNHVQPENNFKKMLGLKKVDRTVELQTRMNKPKASIYDFLKVERESDIKARYFRDPDTENAEQLYANIQANLKGGHFANASETHIKDISQNQDQQQPQIRPQMQQQQQQQPQAQHQQPQPQMQQQQPQMRPQIQMQPQIQQQPQAQQQQPQMRPQMQQQPQIQQQQPQVRPQMQQQQPQMRPQMQQQQPQIQQQQPQIQMQQQQPQIRPQIQQHPQIQMQQQKQPQIQQQQPHMRPQTQQQQPQMRPQTQQQQPQMRPQGQQQQPQMQPQTQQQQPQMQPQTQQQQPQMRPQTQQQQPQMRPQIQQQQPQMRPQGQQQQPQIQMQQQQPQMQQQPQIQMQQQPQIQMQQQKKPMDHTNTAQHPSNQTVNNNDTRINNQTSQEEVIMPVVKVVEQSAPPTKKPAKPKQKTVTISDKDVALLFQDDVSALSSEPTDVGLAHVEEEQVLAVQKKPPAVSTTFDNL